MKTKQVLILLLVLITIFSLSACGTSEEDPQLAVGERLFTANCLSCHPPNPASPRVGPLLVGLGANLQAAGWDAAALLEDSIRYPSREITTGYQDLMPAAEVLGLSDEDINALVAYLLNLSE